MQGFRQSGNDFILKELAILSRYGEDNNEAICFLFKPPFSWSRLNEKYKKENQRLKFCIHGLDWNSGDIDYNQIGNILREALRNAKKILVMGSLKKIWLERFKFKNVIDVTEMGYPPLNLIKLATICPYHNGNKVSCALHNIRLLKSFLQHSVLKWMDGVEVGEKNYKNDDEKKMIVQPSGGGSGGGGGGADGAGAVLNSSIIGFITT